LRLIIYAVKASQSRNTLFAHLQMRFLNTYLWVTFTFRSPRSFFGTNGTSAESMAVAAYAIVSAALDSALWLADDLDDPFAAAWDPQFGIAAGASSPAHDGISPASTSTYSTTSSTHTAAPALDLVEAAVRARRSYMMAQIDRYLMVARSGSFVRPLVVLAAPGSASSV
jgi:hypothetical protein